MCDNCPSKTVENKAEWTRETSKPTGERPLPVPSGRGNTSDELADYIKDMFLMVWRDASAQLGAEKQVVCNSATSMTMRRIQAAIVAAVKEAQVDYRGQINQEFVSLMADNPNLDKQVVRSAIWIMNGRMAEKEAELNQPQEKK